MGDEGFPNLDLDFEHRVQSRHRILQNHADELATDGTHLARRLGEEILLVESDFAAHDP